MFMNNFFGTYLMFNLKDNFSCSFQDQGYMSYVDYSREYSPAPPVGDPAYTHFKSTNAYNRTSPPSSDPPSSLPSSLAPPPYTPTPTQILNGVVKTENGKLSHSGSSDRLINGGLSISLNGTLKHDLVKDVQLPDITSDLGQHAKFILPPQANMKPGTLV